MTVKQLIAKLRKVKNQNLTVILAKDAEGNNFSDLHEFSEEYYDKKYNCLGEGEKAVILWPV